MSQFIEQFRAFYSGLDSKRQRILWAALVLTAATIIGVGAWAGSDSYQNVWTDDDAEAMAAAMAVLEERNIPYKVTDDGRSISVPKHMSGQAKVSIASTGNVVGLEIIETISPGTTPRREEWFYQRALQGELTRTLLTLDEVEACRVHLVLPDKSAFLRSSRQGSASVALRLRAGQSMNERQILGITSLVAGAVEGLDPSQVVLTDESGSILTRSGSGDPLELQASTLLESRNQQERAHQLALESILERILGSPNFFNVAVAVELDNTSTQQTVRAPDPDSQVIISEQIVEEESKGTRAGGVPGTESNLPEKPSTPSTGTERSSSQTQVNYDYKTTETLTTQLAGTVKRLTASVTVDSAVIQKLVAGSEGTHSEESLREELTEAIQDTIGFQAERGDSISLAFMPYNASLSEAATDLAEAPFDLVRYLPYALAALALLLVFVFVLRPMMVMITNGPQPEGVVVGPDGNLIAVADGEPTEEDLSLAERLRHMVDNFEAVDARELNRLVEAQTQASTQVLRRWMASA